MVVTMKHLFAALLLLIAAGSAEAQTFGSSTIETTPVALTAVSNVFTPTCPTLGGGFAVENVVVTAASQSIALPATCPGSSVGLFVTFNICNGKSGTVPCNGTATGPFSPGISFGAGFEFPGTTAYAVNSTNGNNVSGAKDLVTCEVMGTTGPWSCGAPQYAMTPITNGFVFVNANSCASASGPTCTVSSTSMTGANLLIVCLTWQTFTGDISGVPTDSSSNVYTLGATVLNTSASTKTACYYTQAPAVTSSMTFSAAFTSNTFPVIAALGFSGSVASPLDQTNSNSSGASTVTSIQPGSVTPTQNNELVVAAFGLDNSNGGTPFSVDSGYTLEGTQNFLSGTHVGGGTGYLIQTTTAATNPTFSWSGANQTQAVVISLK